jgi:hypothetical protein
VHPTGGLVRLAEVTLCPLDGIPQVARVAAAHSVVVQATTLFFVAHPPPYRFGSPSMNCLPMLAPTTLTSSILSDGRAHAA